MNNEPLSITTLIAHWIVAFSIIGLLSMGFFMTFTGIPGLLGYHKSLGVIAFVFACGRMIWRCFEGWPPATGSYTRLEHLLARMTHWLLLSGSVALPVTGMLYAGAGGFGFDCFGLTIVAPNFLPDDPTNVEPYSEFLFMVGREGHSMIAYVMAAAVLLHIAAAVKHHLIDRDTTLLRMTGKIRPAPRCHHDH